MNHVRPSPASQKVGDAPMRCGTLRTRSWSARKLHVTQPLVTSSIMNNGPGSRVLITGKFMTALRYAIDLIPAIHRADYLHRYSSQHLASHTGSSQSTFTPKSLFVANLAVSLVLDYSPSLPGSVHGAWFTGWCRVQSRSLNVLSESSSCSITNVSSTCQAVGQDERPSICN